MANAVSLPPSTGVSITISSPTMTALNITGISDESTGSFFICTFLSIRPVTAPRRVAAEPKSTSHMPIGLEILPMIQPIVSPGIAAGVRVESTVRASESLNCTGP